MDIIERYAVEAGVEGHFFSKGRWVEKIYLYIYEEIDRYNLWKPGFIHQEPPFMQGYDYNIYLGYIKPSKEQNSILRHDTQ